MLNSPCGHLSFVLTRILVTLFLCCAIGGCAATSTAILDEELLTNKKPLSSYRALIINDFELNRDLFTDAPDDKMGERDKKYARLPAALADSVESDVKSRYIYSSVYRNKAPAARDLVLKGKFTRISRFRVSIEGKIVDGGTGEEVAFFRQTLWDVLDTTEAVNRLGQEVADFISRIQYR